MFCSRDCPVSEMPCSIRSRVRSAVNVVPVLSGLAGFLVGYYPYYLSEPTLTGNFVREILVPTMGFTALANLSYYLGTIPRRREVDRLMKENPIYKRHIKHYSIRHKYYF